MLQPFYSPELDKLSQFPVYGPNESERAPSKVRAKVRAKVQNGAPCCGEIDRKIAQAILAAMIFLTTAGALALNATEPLNGRMIWPCSEVLLSASMSWILFTLFNREKGDVVKSFVGDYATPIFLAISQACLNLSSRARAQGLTKVVFFGLINCYGGVALAGYIHSIFHKRENRGLDAPLVSSIIKQSYTRFRVLLDSPKKRSFFAGLTGGLGMGAIVISQTVNPFFRDLGLMLLASAVAHVVMELCWRRATVQFTRGIKSRSVEVYRMMSRAILRVFHSLPGALMVGAELAAQRRMPSLSMGIYLLTGAVIGCNQHLRQLRFSEVPIKHLIELKGNNKHYFPPKTAFSWLKWVVGGPCLLIFVGLTMGGYDPSTNTFTKTNPFAILAIGAFAISLYTTYFFSEWARVEFLKKANHHPIANLAYYLTHYSLSFPLTFLYTMGKFSIDDQAIDRHSRFGAAVAAMAWASLGYALGREASGRFDLPDPRFPSSLYFGLFGHYFVNLLAGRSGN